MKLIQKDWKEVGLRNKEIAETFLNAYEYSSYQEARGKTRNQSIILNRKPFPVHFDSLAAAEREVQDWLNPSLGKA